MVRRRHLQQLLQQQGVRGVLRAEAEEAEVLEGGVDVAAAAAEEVEAAERRVAGIAGEVVGSGVAVWVLEMVVGRVRVRLVGVTLMREVRRSRS
jgi:hypothetical protein